MRKVWLVAAVSGVVGMSVGRNSALAAAPLAVQVNIASGFEDRWPLDSDLDFNDQNIAYNFTRAAIGDVDGDGIPDVALATTVPGAASHVTVKGWNPEVKGSALDFPGVGSVALGDFGDGPVTSTGQRAASLVVTGSPGGSTTGLVQSYSWTVNPSPGLALSRSVMPFGPNYAGGITVAAGDVNGDGTNDLIAVAQTPPPGANGQPGSRVVAMSPSPGGGGTGPSWTRAFTVDATPPDVTSAISVASGPLLGDGTSEILALFNDPITGQTELSVARKSISIIFHNDAGEESKVYVIGGMDPKGQNIIHRDLAARMCVADLNGDGRDEVIVSGNDGSGPVVDILHLADVTANDGTTEALDVTSVTPITFSPTIQALYGSDWSSVEFLPSATSAVLDPSPLIAPQDAGTLLLTTAFVPEPGCLMMAPMLFMALRRKRRGA